MDEDDREAWLIAEGKEEKDVLEDQRGEYVLVEEDFIPLEGDSFNGSPKGMKKRYLPDQFLPVQADVEEDLPAVDEEE